MLCTTPLIVTYNMEPAAFYGGEEIGFVHLAAKVPVRVEKRFKQERFEFSGHRLGGQRALA